MRVKVTFKSVLDGPEKYVGEACCDGDGSISYNGPRKDAVEKLVDHFTNLGYVGEYALEQIANMKGQLSGSVLDKYDPHNRSGDSLTGTKSEKEEIYEPLIPDLVTNKIDLGNNNFLDIGLKKEI